MSKPLKGFCSGILVGLGQNFSSLGGVSGEPGGETLPLGLHVAALLVAGNTRVAAPSAALLDLVQGALEAEPVPRGAAVPELVWH
mgnify:CR=1 FL=1